MRIIIFLLLLILLSPKTTFAVLSSSQSAQVVDTKVESNYVLPYPGILPNNPLYSIKIIRDHIVLFLVSDPLKKADLKLLQADKRLQAGIYLIDEDKQNAKLAVSTISKGQNYFSQAIDDLLAAEKAGKDVDELLNHLYQASLKHSEVLQDLEKRVDKDVAIEIESLRVRILQLQKEVESIKLRRQEK